MVYQQRKGWLLIINLINDEKTKLVAKILSENPLEVIIENNGRPLNRMDFKVHNELTAKVQQKGLKLFLEEEKISGSIYPARLKEVIELSPKIDIFVSPIVNDVDDTKKIVFDEIVVQNVNKEIIEISTKPIILVEEILLNEKSTDTEEIVSILPTVIYTKVTLPVVALKKEAPKKVYKKQIDKNQFDKKLLGDLYFQMYFALQKATGMKVISDFAINIKTPIFIFIPSKSTGKFSIQKRLELAWDFFKENFGDKAELPYFHIPLPDSMPSDVLTLDITTEYNRILKEIEIVISEFEPSSQ